MKIPIAEVGRVRQLAHEAAGYNILPTVTQVTRSLLVRTPTSDDTQSSSTCKPGDNSAVCQKPVGSDSTQTLPIILGAVIPICCALVVFFFLHRRYLRKQKLEDENDKYKSLDFGVGRVGTGKHGIPEMTVTDLGPSPLPGTRGHHDRGMSLDVMSPYLLPSGLHDSRESLHSLSRSIHDEHDPYRPVTALRDIGDPSKHRFADNGSIFSVASDKISSHEKAALVSNAQRMSQTDPKLHSPVDSKMPTPHDSKSSSEEFMLHDLPAAKDRALPPPPPAKPAEQDTVVESMIPPPRTSSAAAAVTKPQLPQIHTDDLPRINSEHIIHEQFASRESSNYGDANANHTAFPPVPSTPVVTQPDSPLDFPFRSNTLQPESAVHSEHNNEQHQPQSFNQQRLSIMGLRPLPPDNMLIEDNPEQRANRIRSFYKEYFDDSKGDQDHAYYGDYDDYYDGAVYDEASGQFIMASKPFAQAPGRRAMTPPPRGASGPPRFSGGRDPHRRQYSSMSHARGRPPMLKRQLPPPKALHSLPTPAKLDLESAIGNSIDFAPPSSFRDIQNGRRPDSPAGIRRPYSPAVRPFTPLASAYDDLAVMPSPHLLRKSGTFTALDFAPPRIRAQDVGSDSGSIRSARSGISAMQSNAVRAGAYRVSRIPREMVTTREDLSNQLRPKLNMVTPA